MAIPESDRFMSDNGMNGGSFTPDDIGAVLSWGTISAIHRSRNGIYRRGGRLVSLLTDFGKINPPYQDRYRDNGRVISYTGAGRRGDQKLDGWNQAMLNAIESEHAVPLFCKLGVNRWQFLGFWRVAAAKYVFDEKQQRMLWKFRLVTATKLIPGCCAETDTGLAKKAGQERSPAI
jgi:hypothetical protein